MQEIQLSKKHIKYVLLLAALLLGVLVIDVFADKDARDAAKTAEESLVELFSIDFRRDIAAQLPPCTETGREFWMLHLGTIQDAFKARGATVQGVRAERNGAPEPYTGIGGEGQIGQIVPVKLTIAVQSKDGQIETSESEIRILMIKGQDGEWLLDGLAVERRHR
jgi:hypothetical protein